MDIDKLKEKSKKIISEGEKRAKRLKIKLEEKVDETEEETTLLDEGKNFVSNAGNLAKTVLGKAVVYTGKGAHELAKHGYAGTADKATKPIRETANKILAITKEKYHSLKNEFLENTVQDGKVDSKKAGAYIGASIGENVDKFTEFVMGYANEFMADPTQPAQMEDRVYEPYGTIGSALEETVGDFSIKDVKKCKSFMRVVKGTLEGDEHSTVRDAMLKDICEMAFQDSQKLKAFYETSGNSFAVAYVDKYLK